MQSQELELRLDRVFVGKSLDFCALPSLNSPSKGDEGIESGVECGFSRP